MTIAGIQEKIKELEAQKIRAELQIEQIVKEWEDTYSISTIEEAEALVVQMEGDVVRDEKRLEELMEKIESLADWDSL